MSAAGGAPLAAAVLFAVAAMALVAGFSPARGRLGRRVRPYSVSTRVRMGRGAGVLDLAHPERSGGVLRELFGPPVLSMARALGALVDAAGEESLSRRLRQAGFAGVSPDDYRVRQLGGALLGAAAGAGTASAVGWPAGVALGMAGLGFIFGVTRQRARLDRALEERRIRLRLELYTVNQLIALNIRTGGGPVQAVRRVTERGRGTVVDDFGEALRLISGGTSAQEAFARIARATPEEHAARTYDLLASGAERGVDLAGVLLQFSEDLRDARREDLRRSATRRRAAMLIPTIAVLAPVMLLFVIAPIPSFIFGAR